MGVFCFRYPFWVANPGFRLAMNEQTPACVILTVAFAAVSKIYELKLAASASNLTETFGDQIPW